MQEFSYEKFFRGICNIANMEACFNDVSDETAKKLLKAANDVKHIVDLDIENISFESIDNAEKLYHLIEEKHRSMPELISSFTDIPRKRTVSVFI
jgi:hypothetical protein